MPYDDISAGFKESKIENIIAKPNEFNDFYNVRLKQLKFSSELKIEFGQNNRRDFDKKFQRKLKKWTKNKQIRNTITIADLDLEFQQPDVPPGKHLYEFFRSQGHSNVAEQIKNSDKLKIAIKIKI